MSRPIDTDTLNMYARQFAVWWIQGYETGRPDRDREWLGQQFWSFTFLDEFNYLVDRVPAHLTGDDLVKFTAMVSRLSTIEPRKDEVFRGLLSDKLAVDPDGEHIPGKIGTTVVGSRDVGKRVSPDGVVRAARWNVYAGEEDERSADSGVADTLPPRDSLFINDEHTKPVTREG